MANTKIIALISRLTWKIPWFSTTPTIGYFKFNWDTNPCWFLGLYLHWFVGVWKDFGIWKILGKVICIDIFEGRKTNKYLEYELKRFRFNSLLKKREKKLSLCLQNDKKMDSLTTLKAAFVEKTRNLDKMNEEKVR